MKLPIQIIQDLRNFCSNETIAGNDLFDLIERLSGKYYNYSMTEMVTEVILNNCDDVVGHINNFYNDDEVLICSNEDFLRVLDNIEHLEDVTNYIIVDGKVWDKSQQEFVED